MIKRIESANEARKGLRNYPVTALLGPRQCGKTTLARSLAVRGHWTFFDLESPRDLARLQNPLSALETLRGTVVIDEIQRRPDLLPILRVLADRRPLPARFLILGSASPDLMKGSSESLAGRVRFVDMSGFTLDEIGPSKWSRHWLRGGFPNSYLARTEAQSFAWRDDFLRAFLERDLPQLGVRVPATTMRRFWTMLAHYHAQRWNASEIAASLGVAHTTVRSYLDLLSGAFVVRQLPPWFENLGKRVVKAPKVYVRDSGLLHALLRLPAERDLSAHPKRGASWEGYALEQILSRAGDRDAYYWATHGGAEIDLLLIRRGKRWGFEFKLSEAPVATKSMRVAIDDLGLSRLWIVYPGPTSFRVDAKIECVSIAEAIDLAVLRRR